MACPLLEQLERFVNDKLSGDQRGAVEAHVAECAECARRVAEVRSNVGLAHQIERTPARDDLSDVREEAGERDHCEESTRRAPADSDITLSQSTWSTAEESEPSIPKELGTVRLIRSIGRGGMGEVWLGRDELLNRDVAVKFLLNAKPAADDPGFRSFLEGARAAAVLRHPNLTVLYLADLVDNVPYLVMEYVDGPTVADVLKRLGALHRLVALEVITRVAEAIAELHDRGIIHRDIKPANVMLDRDGGVFVTDFGLACERKAWEIGAPAEGIAGTLPYMAPELFEQTVSVRSDVYALGIMAFELLTGVVPFRGTAAEIHQQHTQAPLPVDRLHERGVGSALIEVLERATNKNAMFRYKSARQFLRALQKAQREHGGSTAAKPDLAALVSRADHADDTSAQVEKSATPGSSYYEHLKSKALERRSMRPSAEPDTARHAEPDRPPATAPEATLQRDVPCITCGYNLRGLARDWNCPECGKPIPPSLNPNRLMFADSLWLARVASGVRIASISALAAVVALPLGGYIVSALFHLLPSLRTRQGLLLALPLILIVLLAPWVVAYFGVIRSTAREPREASAADAPFRRAGRALAGIWLLLLGVGLPCLMVLRSSVPDWAFGASAAVVLVATLCWLAAYLRYVSSLTERVPDREGTRRARRFSLVLAALAAMIVLSNFVLPYIFSERVGIARALAGLVGLSAMVALPLLTWGLLQRCSRALRNVLANATPHSDLFGESQRPTDASDVMASPDVLCIKCGYNLHGLSEERRCPECGTPISRSTRGDLLSTADPDWLRRVYRGQLAVVIGCAAGFAAIMLPFLAVIIWRSGIWPAYADALFEFVPAVIPLSAILVFVGIVGTTTLDPRLTLTEQPIALRRLARGAALATLAAMVVGGLLTSASFMPAAFAAVVKPAVWWTILVLFTLTATVFSVYLARLAERVPDTRLAAKTKLTAKRFAILVTICLAGKLIATAAGYVDIAALSRSESSAWALLGVAISFCGLFAFVYAIALMVRWWAFRKVLKRCLLEARAHEERQS